MKWRTAKEKKTYDETRDICGRQQKGGEKIDEARGIFGGQQKGGKNTMRQVNRNKRARDMTDTQKTEQKRTKKKEKKAISIKMTVDQKNAHNKIKRE